MRRNQKRGLSYTTVALITLAIMVVVSYLAFTKELPFREHFEIQATVPNANQLKPGTSVVRIAGVNVGKVSKVEPLGEDGNGAMVTMEITKSGLPIHRDAKAKVRPRIFLEGNYFVDISPGTPSEKALGDGGTILVLRSE